MTVCPATDVEDDPRKVRQMERELQITMKLKHAHIVNLLDVVFEEQFLILIFELATGAFCSPWALAARFVPSHVSVRR